MTLPDVAAKLRSDNPYDLTNGGDSIELVLAAFEADPDYRLRDRVEEARDRHSNPSHKCDKSGFLDALLGPSPGPTLRERMTKLCYDSPGAVVLVNGTQMLLISEVRAALDPPKGG